MIFKDCAFTQQVNSMQSDLINSFIPVVQCNITIVWPRNEAKTEFLGPLWSLWDIHTKVWIRVWMVPMVFGWVGNKRTLFFFQHQPHAGAQTPQFLGLMPRTSPPLLGPQGPVVLFFFLFASGAFETIVMRE